MFDSGVGGLTVLHVCLVSLPEENFVYLGDTEMFPYGSRDPARLRERIRAIAERLLGDDSAKLLVIACNTATSIGDDVAREVAAEHGVEVVPVVEPQAEIAAAITDSGRVGVLATPEGVDEQGQQSAGPQRSPAEVNEEAVGGHVVGAAGGRMPGQRKRDQRDQRAGEQGEREAQRGAHEQRCEPGKEPRAIGSDVARELQGLAQGLAVERSLGQTVESDVFP